MQYSWVIYYFTLFNKLSTGLKCPLLQNLNRKLWQAQRKQYCVIKSSEKQSQKHWNWLLFCEVFFMRGHFGYIYKNCIKLFYIFVKLKMILWAIELYLWINLHMYKYANHFHCHEGLLSSLTWFQSISNMKMKK